MSPSLIAVVHKYVATFLNDTELTSDEAQACSIMHYTQKQESGK
jgi:hypothetical protein